MRFPRTLTVLAAAVFPLALTALVAGGCGNKDKEEPVVTTPPPPPPPPPTPSAPTVIAPETPDAGADADAADGDGSDGRVVVGGPTGLQRCCAAIKQNQKNAPPEQQVMYGIAIAACNAGQLGQIPAALRGGCQ